MRPIQQTCTPRPDLLGGTFNPEIFTASLHQVLKAYRGEETTSHGLYTQAEPFFREATYPTEGMRSVLGAALGRLAGDNSRPAIQRLETGFGGGKTHTLIALTHLAYRGQELADVTADVIDSQQLPAAGSVDVVGISGEIVPVHRQQGSDLVAHTLWAEIARQLDGQALVDRIDAEAMVTRAGDNRPRINQNHVFLLVPETVKLRTEAWDESRTGRVRERLNRLQDLGGRRIRRRCW